MAARAPARARPPRPRPWWPAPGSAPARPARGSRPAARAGTSTSRPTAAGAAGRRAARRAGPAARAACRGSGPTRGRRARARSDTGRRRGPRSARAGSPRTGARRGTRVRPRRRQSRIAAVLPLALDASDHVAGPGDAPLELVMYGDFQCPYCAAAQSIVRRVRTRLDDRLRFVFRHLPLPEVHPDAERAAEAAEAAGAQDAFWPMHDALYANHGKLGESDLIDVARRLGLDVERF